MIQNTLAYDRVWYSLPLTISTQAKNKILWMNREKRMETYFYEIGETSLCVKDFWAVIRDASMK